MMRSSLVPKTLILLLLLLLLLLVPHSVAAQTATLTDTSCPGNGCLTVNSGGNGTLGIQVSGTFSATLQFEQTVDGTTWAAWTVSPSDGSASVTSTTTTGMWQGVIAGTRAVRVRLSSGTSGAAVVSVIVTQAKLNSGPIRGPVSSASTSPNRFSGPVYVNRNSVAAPPIATSSDQDGFVVWGTNATQATISAYTFGAAAPVFAGGRAGGTAAAPSAVSTDDALFRFQGFGYFTAGAGGWAAKAEMQVNAGENWTDVAQGSYVSWLVTPNGSTTRAARMRLFGSGGLTVGSTFTTDPGAGVVQATNLFITGVARVTGSNATTTGQTLIDVTGLSVPLVANATYTFEASLSVSTTAVTTGTKYAVQFSQAGASVEAQFWCSLASTTAAISERMNALNTANTTACLTTASQSGAVLIKGVVTVGVNAGNLTIQHLKVTSGTSTVFINSFLTATRIA